VTHLAVSSDAAVRRAPDAVAPPPGNPRFPLFDGLRAIAAMSILVTHCAGATGFNLGNPLGTYTARMNAGVALFFVISGFLLYRPFLAARFAGRPVPGLLAYARRRALRIVPAYWIALTVLALTVGLPGVFTDRWWVYYGFLQIYDQSSVLGGIGPAWSLCVEVSFYVALPLWALLMARVQRGRSRRTMVRTEVLGLLALGAIAVAVRVLSFSAAGGQTLWHVTLPGNLDWFGWGMAIALASVMLQGREHETRAGRLLERSSWISWLAAAVTFWVLSTHLHMPRAFPPLYTPRQYLVEHLLFPLVGALLVLPAVFGPPGRGVVRRILALRVLQWFGLVSYGIFLWHQPLMHPLSNHRAAELLPGAPFLSMLLATTAVSAVCAAASYYAIERPLLRFKDRRRKTTTGEPQPAAASAG
jgi:peptidoglycan/LPS O-acetylase OafA/YrhL